MTLGRGQHHIGFLLDGCLGWFLTGLMGGGCHSFRRLFLFFFNCGNQLLGGFGTEQLIGRDVMLGGYRPHLAGECA